MVDVRDISAGNFKEILFLFMKTSQQTNKIVEVLKI